MRDQVWSINNAEGRSRTQGYARLRLTLCGSCCCCCWTCNVRVWRNWGQARIDRFSTLWSGWYRRVLHMHSVTAGYRFTGDHSWLLRPHVYDIRGWREWLSAQALAVRIPGRQTARESRLHKVPRMWFTLCKSAYISGKSTSGGGPASVEFRASQYVGSQAVGTWLGESSPPKSDSRSDRPAISSKATSLILTQRHRAGGVTAGPQRLHRPIASGVRLACHPY